MKKAYFLGFWLCLHKLLLDFHLSKDKHQVILGLLEQFDVVYRKLKDRFSW